MKETTNESRLWECTHCKNKGELVAWSYEEMVEKGYPVCPSCGNDMSLVAGSK